MKTWGKVATIAVVALALAGCTAEPATVAVTSNSDPAPTKTPTSEQGYLKGIADVSEDMSRAPDALWIEIGESACVALSADVTPSQVAGQLVASGNVTDAEAGAIVVEASTHLCPEYAPQ